MMAAATAGCLSVSLGCHEVRPLPQPTGPLTLEKARQFVVDLVNHDRASEGLEPVAYSETAERAAQRHAEDMARHGFTAHWGTDGSVPEQRYTEAGGDQFVQENAACFFDGVSRELVAEPTLLAAELSKIERAFMNEVPPNDGHRRNILDPWHTHLGVGLAQPQGVAQPCLAQEFLDVYGEYEALPLEVTAGTMVRVAGSIREPVEFAGVGLARIEAPKALKPSALNKTSTYRIPEPEQVFFPKGYKTPKPVTLSGNQFSIDLALGEGGHRGRYEISVWGRFPDADSLVMISLRTVTVR